MEKLVANLTLTEKIGQMFMVGIDGTEAAGDIIELIQTYRIGGIILNQKNLENVEQTQKLINDLKAANMGNSVPLFIAMSQEPGRGNQLPKDIRTLPSIKYISENGDKQIVYEAQVLTANLLKKLGINMNFAPLLDMGGMVDGVPLGDRCISNNNTTIVSSYAAQTANAYNSSGIIAVPKYFPGHTSTKADRSNITIPYTKKSLSKLEQHDLVPFKYIIDEGVDTMLVGHIHLSKINMFTPSSLSNKVITKVLKGRYKFNGLVIADDMCSTCIKVQYSVKEAARRAIMAGNDIIIIGEPQKAKMVLEDIEKQISHENISEKEIDARVQKILNLKDKYNLNDEESYSINLSEENEKIDALIARIRQLHK